MSRSLQGKVAIVTGASSGIGLAAVARLRSAGARVVMAARSQENLENAARTIGPPGGDLVCIPTDVTVGDQVEHLVNQTVARFGRVDIAVCNAGVYLRKEVKDVTVADLERIMAVNFYGTVHLVRAVLPLMLAKRSGHIVAVTSVDGRKGLPPDGAYVAAKFAATGYMDVLRQELRGTGVHATTILPGRVDTPMIDNLDLPLASARISADRVGRAVVRGIVRRRREIIVPFAGPKLLVVLNAFSPAIGDTLVRWFRLRGRERDTSKGS